MEAQGADQADNPSCSSADSSELILMEEDDLVQLSFLRDEEVDALIRDGLLSNEFQLSSPLDQSLTFTYAELLLHVKPGKYYPAQSVEFSIENLQLSREDVDALRRQLRSIIAEAEATNNLERWRTRDVDSEFGLFEHLQVVYHLVYETVQHLQAQRKRQSGREDVEEKYLSFLGPEYSQRKMAVPIAPSAPSASDQAHELLGKSRSQIADMIPAFFRVLHIESILRDNMYLAFQRQREMMRHEISQIPRNVLRSCIPKNSTWRRRDDLVDFLLEPCITFHGTQRKFVPSIVRQGFLLPGTLDRLTGAAHDVRCGSTYGMGIYSSPSAEFALSYSGMEAQKTRPDEFFGIKLIVCAVLRGRSRLVHRADGFRGRGEASKGFDSHCSKNGMEYVVFNPGQIIPVYAVHLDFGSHNAEFFDDLPEDPDQWTPRRPKQNRQSEADVLTPTAEMGPGDRQRAKEATFAKASKYFPYGFGPATGSKFVVEAVGEVFDDEEDYGEYQEIRRMEAESETSLHETNPMGEDPMSLPGYHPADEYSEARAAFSKAKVKRGKSPRG